MFDLAEVEADICDDTGSDLTTASQLYLISESAPIPRSVIVKIELYD